MARAPECSVIVPTRDRSHDLARCLRALAAQTLDGGLFEVLVVDDGTTATAAAQGAPPRLDVRHLRGSQAGPSGARNLAASAARGDLLVFTDDDAVPRPGWLAALVEAHRAAPRAGLGGRTEPLDQANAFSRTSARIIELAAAGGANGARDAAFFASNNLALPAEGYRELSGFDERLRVSEDRDICSRWLERGQPLLRVPGAVIQHRFPSRLREYVATQFRYGRGARDHHRLRSARTSQGGFEPSFYARQVVPAVAGALRRGELAEAALLVAWQTANAAGFAVGGFARER